jgi:hypothetical protein
LLPPLSPRLAAALYTNGWFGGACLKKKFNCSQPNEGRVALNVALFRLSNAICGGVA